LAEASLSLAVPPCQGILWWLLLRGSQSRYGCGVMTMTSVSNLDDDLRLSGVCAASVGCQGGCVSPSDGRLPERSAWVFVLVFGRFSINKPTTYSSLLMKRQVFPRLKNDIANGTSFLKHWVRLHV
jgi:hypothetical protein